MSKLKINIGIPRIKRFSIIMLILILGLLQNCKNNTNMHWKEIKTIGTEKSEYNPGIGSNYQFYKFLFISSHIGFLTGDYNKQIDIDIDNMTWTTIHLNKNAIILQTKDSGYHWQENILGKGEIIDFQKVGSKLFALRRSYHGENAEITHSHIHISTNEGNTWQEIFSTEETLDNVYFWTEKDGIATMGFRGQVYDFQTIIKTEDGGKSWKKIIIPQMYPAMDFAITKKGILYFLTPDRHSYIGFNLMTNEYEEFPLNLGEEPFSVVLDNNDNLYFVTENKDNRNILFKKENKSHSFTRIEFPITDTMINDVWIYDNTISIIVDNNGGACYRSEDYGKTWQKENLPNSFIRNVAFFGKDNIWIRSIPGKMLIRN